VNCGGQARPSTHGKCSLMEGFATLEQPLEACLTVRTVDPDSDDQGGRLSTILVLLCL